jgi:hypothetical protein
MTDPLALRVAPDHVNRELYDTLVHAARHREMHYYSQVGPMLRLNFESPADRNRIAALLGEISRYEHAQGRPFLSSIVWYKDMSSPGPGLYRLGVELGAVGGNEDDLANATRQINKTFEFWAGRSREATRRPSAGA